MVYALHEKEGSSLHATSASRASLLVRTLLILLIPLLAAQVAQAQKKEDPDRARRVYLSVEKEALQIPLEIGRVDFSYAPSQADATGHTSINVESVRFFSDKGKGPSGAIRGRRVDRTAMTLTQQEQYFQLRESGLRSLWARYQPEFIRRAGNPPFDTLGINRRTGEVVHLNDLSVHYVVFLRDASERSNFIRDAKKLPGVIGAHGPGEFTLDTETSSLPSRGKPTYQQVPSSPTTPNITVSVWAQGRLTCNMRAWLAQVQTGFGP